MNDLEDAVADALRAKAAAVPHSPMPRLERARRARRGWLVPVAAAAVAVVAAGAAVFVFSSRDQSHPATVTTSPSTTTSAPSSQTLAPGEVYYSLRLTAQANGQVIREIQLWQPSDRAGEWRQAVEFGQTIKDGRVVPGAGHVEGPSGGVCYPARQPTDDSCTAPPSWSNPTVDFLATAPRDPATIADQLHAEAMAVLSSNGQGEELAPTVELHYVSEVLAANGVPADLSRALEQVVAGLPGVTVTQNMATLTGERGTGYSLPLPQGGSTAAIFADGHYLGSPTEVVHHGVAPGLGQPPSRMLD
jgi:hypothetical protein